MEVAMSLFVIIAVLCAWGISLTIAILLIILLVNLIKFIKKKIDCDNCPYKISKETEVVFTEGRLK